MAPKKKSILTPDFIPVLTNDLLYAIIASFLCLRDQLHVACCSRKLRDWRRTQSQGLILRHEGSREGELNETMREEENRHAALLRLLKKARGLRHLRVPDGRDMELVLEAMNRSYLTRLMSLFISRAVHYDEDGHKLAAVTMGRENEQLLSCAMCDGALPSLQSLELNVTGNGLHHIFNALSTGACTKLWSLSLWDKSCRSRRTSWERTSMGNANIGAALEARAQTGICIPLKSLELHGYGEDRGAMGLERALMVLPNLERLAVYGGV